MVDEKLKPPFISRLRQSEARRKKREEDRTYSLEKELNIIIT
jgi:hypothetical protein